MVLADMDGVGVFRRKELKVRLDFDEITGEGGRRKYEKEAVEGMWRFAKSKYGISLAAEK
jgi:hypothetical protein